MTTATEIAETSLPLTHVRIGEIRTASAGLLKVTLGSCVAIALINRLEGICGLAHCFLPFAPEGYNGTSGRYADRAAANLVQRIAPNPAIRKALKAFLCGGNRLLTPEASSRFQVGQMNVDAARASLTGADEGTNAILDCSNFTFTCGKISNMLIGDKESPCN
jgi:chemotaxis protein CheD